MKLIVHVPLSCDMKYLYDYDEDSLPNIGEILEKNMLLERSK